MSATTNPFADEPVPKTETEAECAGRLAYERALLDEAREDVRVGRVVADEDVDAWLDRFTRGEPLPMPEPSTPSRTG